MTGSSSRHSPHPRPSSSASRPNRPNGSHRRPTPRGQELASITHEKTTRTVIKQPRGYVVSEAIESPQSESASSDSDPEDDPGPTYVASESSESSSDTETPLIPSKRIGRCWNRDGAPKRVTERDLRAMARYVVKHPPLRGEPWTTGSFWKTFARRQKVRWLMRWPVSRYAAY